MQPAQHRRDASRRLWRLGFDKTRRALAAAKCMHAQHVFRKEERPKHTKHELYLKRLRVGVEAYVKTLAVKAAAKATVMASVAAELIESGAVVTSVDFESDLEAIPLWQQGDVSLNTADNMQKRMRCRHSDEVTEALGAFWSIAQTRPSSEAEPSGAGASSAASTGGCECSKATSR